MRASVSSNPIFGVGKRTFQLRLPALTELKRAGGGNRYENRKYLWSKLLCIQSNTRSDRFPGTNPRV